MLPRLHNNFPTSQEASDNPDSIYSDHSPILIPIPISANIPPINMISLNVLDGDFGRHRSGFNFIFDESPGEQELRYKKIVKLLFRAKDTYKVDIICLQDANPMIIGILNRYLKKNWKIVCDIKSGGVIIYNNSQLVQISMTIKHTQERRISLTFKHRSNALIEIHNMRAIRSTYFPEEREQDVYSRLNFTEADFSVVVGFIGQKMADLKRVKKNLITSIDSLKASQALGYNFTQIGNFSDGAFLYNKKEKKLSQLEVRVLSFETGQVIEEGPSEKIAANSEEFYPIMRLDDSFKHDLVFGEKTISIKKYQYDLRSFFKDEHIMILPIANINNEFGIGIFFQEGTGLYDVLLERLKDNPNFRFISMEVSGSIWEYDCIFILNDQAEEFYKAVEKIKQEILFNVLKHEILKELKQHIDSITSESVFFRTSSRAKKIKAFEELYKSIEAVDINSLDKPFKDIFNGIIHAWEKPFETKKYMATHTFKLKKKNNSSVTESERVIRRVKNTIHSIQTSTLYNFREDIIHRLVHEIARLDKKKKHALAIKKKVCLEELLDDIQGITLDKTVGFFYQRLIAWEKTVSKDKVTHEKMLKDKTGIMRMCPFFSSSSYSMLQKLKTDLSREAAHNGEIITPH